MTASSQMLVITACQRVTNGMNSGLHMRAGLDFHRAYQSNFNLRTCFYRKFRRPFSTTSREIGSFMDSSERRPG